MQGSISVNQAIDQLDTLAGGVVVICGILHFAFEDISLRHFPVEDQRDELHGSFYGSGASALWLSVGDGSIQFDEATLRPWHKKKVLVTGALRSPQPHLGGCGHLSGFAGELLVMSIERA